MSNKIRMGEARTQGRSGIAGVLGILGRTFEERERSLDFLAHRNILYDVAWIARKTGRNDRARFDETRIICLISTLPQPLDEAERFAIVFGSQASIGECQN